MRIEHVALWTRQLEVMRQFYEQFFSAQAGNRYAHTHDSFASYFLTFADGARLELMQLDDLPERPLPAGARSIGWAHIAIQVESTEVVDQMARHISGAGYILAKHPSWTGDGYYECSVYDPDGNLIEITA